MVPELQILELPFLFRDDAEADFVMDEVIKPELEAAMEKKGLKLFVWAVNGWLDFAGPKPINTTADLQSCKVVMQESEVQLAMYKALGVAATPLPVPEILGGLQTGMVNAYSGSPVFSTAAQWFAHTEAWVDSNHIYQPAAVVFSKRFWDSLEPELKTLIEGYAPQLQKDAREAVRGLDDELLVGFAENGIKVSTWDATQREAFRAAAWPSHQAMVDGGDLQTGAMGCLQVRQDLHQHSAVESPTHRDDHPLTRLPEPLSADDLQHAQRQSAGTVVEPSPCFHRQRTRRPRQLSNIEVNGDVIVGMGPATPLLATLAAAIPHDDLAMVSGQRDRVVEAATCRRTVSGHVVDVQAAQAAGTVVAHPGTSAGHVGTAVLAGEGCVALDGVGAHPAGSLSISQGPHESLSGPVGVHLLAAAVQLRLQDGALVGILINLQPQPLDGAA